MPEPLPDYLDRISRALLNLNLKPLDLEQLLRRTQKLVEAGNALESSYDKPERFMAISNARHDWKEALTHWHAKVAEILNA